MISDDGLELYFGSDRPGGAGGVDIYVAKRASKQDAFTSALPIVEIDTPLDEDDPFLEPDGLALWWNVQGDIVRATRPDRMSGWNTPVLVAELNSPNGSDDAPAFTADGLTVYFDSERPGTLGMLDLWSATRPTRTSAFSNLRHETVASTNSFDCCAHVLPGETQVAFTTQRAGMSKIYVSDGLADGSLGTAIPYPLVNTAGRDFDIFATPDGTTVGVSSDRAPSAGVDLWLYERSCP